MIRAPILKIIEASFGYNLYKLILDFPIHKLRTLQELLSHTLSHIIIISYLIVMYWLRFWRNQLFQKVIYLLLEVDPNNCKQNILFSLARTMSTIAEILS